MDLYIKGEKLLEEIVNKYALKKTEQKQKIIMREEVVLRRNKKPLRF